MIRKLRVEVVPEVGLGDVFCLRWEVFEDDGILGYKKLFTATQVNMANDWKSYWDFMWATAKREFEKAQEAKINERK